MAGLRIMAGAARGRSIKMPDASLSVRPILARIKKSLFDILMKRISGSVFCDLFSGSGSVGLEAVSRGASRAVLVEKDRRCAKIIGQNAVMLGFEKKAKVVNSSVELFLEGAEEQFDIIFMGPPYKNEDGMLYLSQPVLNAVNRNNVLKNTGVLIAQHHKRETVADEGNLKIIRREKYGDTYLTFFGLLNKKGV